MRLISWRSSCRLRSAWHSRWRAFSVAGLPTLPPRATLASVNGSFPRTFRFNSLLDDMTYDESGRAGRYDAMNNPIPGSVERSGRYNWTAVLQRTNNTVAIYESKLTVLVFDGRAAGYTPTNSEMVYGDAAVPARQLSFTPGSSSLVLRFPATDARPPVGKGRWIALYSPAAGNKLLTFHRVVSVGEDASTATTIQYDIELQTPTPFGHDPANCRAIVLAGLAEVFERAPLTAH